MKHPLIFLSLQLSFCYLTRSISKNSINLWTFDVDLLTFCRFAFNKLTSIGFLFCLKRLLLLRTFNEIYSIFQATDSINFHVQNQNINLLKARCFFKYLGDTSILHALIQKENLFIFESKGKVVARGQMKLLHIYQNSLLFTFIGCSWMKLKSRIRVAVLTSYGTQTCSNRNHWRRKKLSQETFLDREIFLRRFLRCRHVN